MKKYLWLFIILIVFIISSCSDNDNNTTTTVGMDDSYTIQDTNIDFSWYDDSYQIMEMKTFSNNNYIINYKDSENQYETKFINENGQVIWEKDNVESDFYFVNNRVIVLVSQEINHWDIYCLDMEGNELWNQEVSGIDKPRSKQFKDNSILIKNGVQDTENYLILINKNGELQFYNEINFHTMSYMFQLNNGYMLVEKKYTSESNIQYNLVFLDKTGEITKDSTVYDELSLYEFGDDYLLEARNEIKVINADGNEVGEVDLTNKELLQVESHYFYIRSLRDDNYDLEKYDDKLVKQWSIPLDNDYDISNTLKYDPFNDNSHYFNGYYQYYKQSDSIFYSSHYGEELYFINQENQTSTKFATFDGTIRDVYSFDDSVYVLIYQMDNFDNYYYLINLDTEGNEEFRLGPYHRISSITFTEEGISYTGVDDSNETKFFMYDYTGNEIFSKDIDGSEVIMAEDDDYFLIGTGLDYEICMMDNNGNIDNSMDIIYWQYLNNRDVYYSINPEGKLIEIIINRE